MSSAAQASPAPGLGPAPLVPAPFTGLALALILALALLLAATVTPARATAAVPAWTTYDHDGGRSATDPDSGSPLAPSPAWASAAQLDGPVFAQPLVSGGLVYVATENDTIYALNAATGAVDWQRSVGTPVPSSDLPCGDIGPAVGITSTPVIDLANSRIYAVADTLQGGAVRHELVALDLATGAPAAAAVPVDPPGADPKAILQRASLALSGGRVIIPYGGNSGDCSTYHGWLVSEPQSLAGAPSTFEIDAGAGEHGGAIWGAGDGPALDAAGHVFVSTGNGFGSTSPDLQESVIELDPSLNQIAHWTASNWQALDAGDADLGSSEPLPLPAGLLFDAGKDGVGRLLSAGSLGTAGQLFSAPACGSGGGVFGASLYRAGVIYVPCSGGLAALALSPSSSPSLRPLPGWVAPAGASGPPIFAGGLVWSTGWSGSGLLYGLDPATGAVRFQSDLGQFEHFATPSAGAGRLFTTAGSKIVALTIASFPPATATALQSSANPIRTGSPDTLTATVSPAPDGGTASFRDGGAVLAGCGAEAVDPATGRATCRTSSLAVGAHTIVAAYSGDPYFGPSASPPLIQVVTHALPPGPRPRLLDVRLAAHAFTARRGTVLELRLTQAAKLTVVVRRALPGRRVGRRCRIRARHGRRCTVYRRARRLTLNGRRGRDRLRLRLGRLAPGRYVATIVARNAAGRSSRAVTVRFRILPPRRR